MKKIILFSFFILINYFSANAQSSCEVSTDSTLGKTINTSAPISTSILDQSIFNFYFKNTTSGTIQLKWKVVQRSIPASWDYSMCDYATCRDIFTDSTVYTMYEAVPDFKSYLLFHILPKDQSTATLRIYVYDKNYPLQGDTVTWIIKGVNASGVNDLNNSLRFAMFPNPASDHILIEGENISLNDAEISLYNAMSQELTNTKGISNHINIDLSQYKNGIYFLKIRTEQGITSKKIIVNK
jgi:hypothetical protein